MAKVRVSTLAKEFGMTSKELMGHLADMKIPAKSASSALEDAYVAMVRKQLAPVIEARAQEVEAAKQAEEQAAQEKIIRAAIAKAKNLFIPQISIDSLFCFPVIQCLEATDIHYLRRANGSTDRQPSLHL